MFQKIDAMIYIKHIQYMKKNLVIELLLKVLLVAKENCNMNKYKYIHSNLFSTVFLTI